MKAKRSLFNLVFFILLACLFAYNWYANEVTIKYGNGTYKGEASLGRIVWKGVAHGRGTFTFDAGAKYVGEFKDGKMNGQGTFTYGIGSMTNKITSGTKYVGEWMVDQQWNGTQYDPDGNVTATYTDGRISKRSYN